MLKLLIDYAHKHNIILNINDKDEDGWSLLLGANTTDHNNTEMVKLLIDYANNHNIILEVNEKNINWYSSLVGAIENNNTEIVRLLVKLY